jgi:aspartate/glutamate racemase
MMDQYTYDIRRLALIQAVMAELEAMRAYNEQKILSGCTDITILYSAEYFFQKAEELRNLAHTHDMQLFP